jgi:hypothetical protein
MAVWPMVWRYNLFCSLQSNTVSNPTNSDTKFSRVRGFMTNNNGFWIGWLELVTPSFTFALNYNHLTQVTINNCLRLLPFLTGLRMSFLLLWLGSDFYSDRITHSNDDCILTECFLSLSLVLRPTVSRPVYLGIKHPPGAYDRIFVTIR